MYENQPILIGFAGEKQSGKTTATELLMVHKGFAGLSFAQPMRVFVSELLGVGLDDLEREKETPIDWLDGVTPRRMMQTLGTEWGRNTIHNELWTRITGRAIDSARRAGYAVAISDVRFPNEAEAIRDRGGFVVRVVRPGLENVDAHVSEAPLPAELIDGLLVNDSTHEQLLLDTLGLLRGFRARQIANLQGA